MNVLYVGPFAQRTGYARAGHDYLLALKRTHGVNLAIRPMIESDESWFPGPYEELIPLCNRPEALDPDWADVLISHSVPYGCPLIIEDLDINPETPRVAITTWETDRLGPTYAEGLKQAFDAVWVPSVYCKEALVNGGLPGSAISVVPHCFDPYFYKAKEPARGKDEPYHFYDILTWSWRKGYMALLLAYVTEFKEKDNVVLKIKTPSYSTREMASLARGLGTSTGKYLPPIDMLTDNWSEQQMVDLHQDSDCFVSAAHSEGWGLGAFEAVITGNPVIYVDYSGVRDFLTGAHGAVGVGYTLAPAYTPELLGDTAISDPEGRKIVPVLRNAPVGIDVLEEHWAQPDVYDLKQKMRAAYESRRSLTEDQIYENRAMLTSRFSYDVVGKQMFKLLEGLCA